MKKRNFIRGAINNLVDMTERMTIKSNPRKLKKLVTVVLKDFSLLLSIEHNNHKNSKKNVKL